MWTLGVGSDKSLGRPKEWNGESGGFDDFAFKFSNWLSGLPGDAERFLEESANMGQPILWATLAAREKGVARGVATALRALVGDIILRNRTGSRCGDCFTKNASLTPQRGKLVCWKE